ncbi:MAG: hypothetical protein WCO77_13470 [bacterium]
MTTKKTFGKKLAEARAQVSPCLSRQELADRLQVAGIDVTPAEIALVEADKHSLKYYEVVVLATVLNTTTFSLLC